MNRLIAHGLLKINDQYILIKRTKIKRGKPNSLPEYWDIPGGMVEPGETPQTAVIRETQEEVGLNVTVGPILYEDSNYDEAKDTIFTRLVYQCELDDDQTTDDIVLQLDEHSEYRLIDSLDEMGEEKIVEYLPKTIQQARIINNGEKVLRLERPIIKPHTRVKGTER